MSPEARNRYFGHYWPAACQAKKWRVKDELRRRHTTGECMRLVCGPQTESTTELGPDEITALFTYLDFLANPSSLEKSQRWLDCQQDYRMFNRGRQADWHERKAYGAKGSGKLRKNRFSGAASAQGNPQDTFDPEAIRKRHMTMVNRHRAKKGYTPKQQPGELRQFVTVVRGQVLAGPIVAETVAPTVNSYGEENPF